MHVQIHFFNRLSASIGLNWGVVVGGGRDSVCCPPCCFKLLDLYGQYASEMALLNSQEMMFVSSWVVCWHAYYAVLERAASIAARSTA